MRHLISKLMTGSLVAGGALLVAACGHSESTNVTENTTMTDLNTMAPEGTTNDMTAVDAAGGNAADNSAMMDANATGAMTSNNAM
ncbi:MAG: hypothetical protein JOY99_11175 [Sphingomonadaceae bacterium]|nr:hypothetical protein [Sphingomonadaceae bacterium]